MPWAPPEISAQLPYFSGKLPNAAIGSLRVVVGSSWHGATERLARRAHNGSGARGRKQYIVEFDNILVRGSGAGPGLFEGEEHQRGLVQVELVGVGLQVVNHYPRRLGIGDDGFAGHAEQWLAPRLGLVDGVEIEHTVDHAEAVGTTHAEIVAHTCFHKADHVTALRQQ